MEPGDVILRCRQIVTDAGHDPEQLNVTPLDFFDFTRDIIGTWPKKKIETTPWLKDFAVGLRKLRDDFEEEVRADPLILYKPAHSVALEFHQSQARIRYFRGGNRISKTQAGLADNYWVMTGTHPYRPKPPLPAAVAIVGVNFSKYAPKVFEAKYLYGENGNPISPAFPEGGKWFNRYDSRKHILYIGCHECAMARKAASCKHPKSSIVLFSDIEGPMVLQGGQYAQIQFDEQIQPEFLGEALKRLETVPNSGMIVTETPLNGKGWWTNTILARDAAAKKTIEDTNIPLVTLHTIDQFAAGLTPHAMIKASMQLMSPAEVEARVYGRPAAFNESGVFDSWEISSMIDAAREPTRGTLYFAAELDKDAPRPSADVMYDIVPGMSMRFEAVDSGMLRVWEEPNAEAQYIIGGDVAQGLTARDASAASVLRMEVRGHDIHFRLVAQLHGWQNPRIYAEDVIKLALWYNEALVVVERNGPGAEALRSMIEWGYWNIFQDVNDPAQAQFSMDPITGISTNVATKPMMVACLQQVIKDRRTGRRTIEIPCAETLDELGSFGQEKTPSGKSITFQAAAGMADDRVISLMVAVYAAKVFGVYDFNKDATNKKKAALESLSPHDRALWEEFHRYMREREMHD